MESAGATESSISPGRLSLRSGFLQLAVFQDRQGIRQDLLGAIWEFNARAGEREGG